MKNEPIMVLVTLNIGTLTGRNSQLAEMLDERDVDIACLQETKLQGAKSKRIGGGYKIYYMGTSSRRNGVALVVAKHLQKGIVSVYRSSDRIISLRLKFGQLTLNVISCYAPQTGCPKKEKSVFYELLETHIRKHCREGILLIGGDFNGHVGAERPASGISHGGNGFGSRNSDGERVLSFTEASNCVIVNTQFERCNACLTTYKSGRCTTQVDYWMMRNEDAFMVLDSNVASYIVAKQHMPVFLELSLGVRKGKAKNDEMLTRWSLSSNSKSLINSSMIRLEPVDENMDVDVNYEEMVSVITSAANEILPQQATKSEKIWCHFPEVQAAVNEELVAFEKCKDKETKKRRETYEAKKSVAKNAVTSAEAKFYHIIYTELETTKGDETVFKLAKATECTPFNNIIRAIKDTNGRILRKDCDIRNRWKNYFAKQFEEAPYHLPIPEIPRPILGSVPRITVDEVGDALANMINNKDVGPDGIPGAIFKLLGEPATKWLADMFNLIIARKQVPSRWNTSIIVPEYSGRGDIMDCANYGSKRIWCHSMGIFERILDKRIRDLIPQTQGEGVGKASARMDAVFAARMLMEKHREKNVSLHMAFLDQSFDQVSHAVITYAMRKNGIPEQYIEWLLFLRKHTDTYVICASGKTKSYTVDTKTYQGSELLSLLNTVCMNAITEGLPETAYGRLTILYSNKAVLWSSVSPDTLQRNLATWEQQFALFGLKTKSTYLEAIKHSERTICVHGQKVSKTKSYVFLGCTLSTDGCIEDDVKGRINAAWMTWRKLEGFMCDKRILIKIKSKIYRTIVRPVALDGAECWPTTKQHEQLLQAMEMRMLRWSLDCKKVLTYEKLLDTFGIVPIKSKVMEARMRWLGNVRRAEDGSLVKEAHKLVIKGKRRKGKPKLRWNDAVGSDLYTMGLQMIRTANEAQWTRVTEQADPAVAVEQEEKKLKEWKLLNRNREGDASSLQAIEDENENLELNEQADDLFGFFREFAEMSIHGETVDSGPAQS